MQIADYSGVFFIFVPAPHQGIWEGTAYDESTVYVISQSLPKRVYWVLQNPNLIELNPKIGVRTIRIVNFEHPTRRTSNQVVILE